MNITVPKAEIAKLKKRFANLKYSPLAQAQYQAMQSVLKPIKKDMQVRWASENFKRGGSHFHRRAIVKGVTGYITRRGVQVIGYVGVSRKNLYAMIVNVLNSNFKAKNGKIVPGRFVREKVFPLAQVQAKNYEAFLQRAALRMANGK